MNQPSIIDNALFAAVFMIALTVVVIALNVLSGCVSDPPPEREWLGTWTAHHVYYSPELGANLNLNFTQSYTADPPLFSYSVTSDYPGLSNFQTVRGEWQKIPEGLLITCREETLFGELVPCDPYQGQQSLNINGNNWTVQTAYGALIFTKN